MDEPVIDVVGRAAELERVQTLLALDHGALVLEGEPGIGKTTVWLAGVERARERGFRVLEARPAESEATLSYAGLSDLLGAAFDELGDSIPAPQRSALGAALLRVEVQSAADPRTIATAVVSMLASLASRSRVLVAVDDVQWLDRASARALEFALRRIPGGVCVFAALRIDADTSSSPLPFFEGERVRLGPLSLASLQHVLRRELGFVPTRPLLGRLADVSEGNPFHALELARAAEADPAPLFGRLRVPPTLSELVATRVRRLPRSTREALLAASASWRTTVPDVDVRALEAAEAAGVVRLDNRRAEFVHPLYRAAIYSSASAAKRRALHDGLAVGAVDVEERARHLALAGHSPDDAVADAIEQGAERARARGALDAAGELLEIAARLTPRSAGEADMTRRLRAAEYHLQAGEHRKAEALIVDVLGERPSKRLRSAARRLLGQIRYESNFPSAIELFEEALAEAEDPETVIGLRLDLAFALVPAGDPVGSFRHAQTALAAARRLGETPLLGDAIAVHAIAGFMAGRAVPADQLEYAVSLEDRDRPQRLLMRPSSIAAQIAVYEGRLEEARERLYEIRGWALERGQDGELPFMLIHLAAAEWRAGDYAAAHAAADEALLFAERTGSDTMTSVALIHRAMAHSYLGDVSAARSALAESRMLLERGGWAYAHQWANRVEGFLELSCGDPKRAVEVLEPAIAAAEAGGVPQPWHGAFVPDAVEALVRSGDTMRAARLLSAFESAARAAMLPWAIADAARSSALVLAADNELDAALDSVRAALGLVGELEMPFQAARTWLVAGEIHRRRREKRLAYQALTDASTGFEVIGAALWAERARAERRRVGLRRSAAGELTETERRIAELAAGGLTNREVAHAAFVSTKTVETNLSRVYAKLGIRSRAELGARMVQQRDTGTET